MVIGIPSINGMGQAQCQSSKIIANQISQPTPPGFALPPDLVWYGIYNDCIFNRSGTTGRLTFDLQARH